MSFKRYTEETHRIIKFQWMVSPIDHKLIEEWVDYKRQMINRFHTETHEEVVERYCTGSNRYPPNPRLMSVAEVVDDILINTVGCITQEAYKSQYVAYPLTNKEVVEWVDNNRPSWSKQLKRFNFHERSIPRSN